jgi:putative transposase
VLLVTKYRRPVLDRNVRILVYSIIREVLKKLNGETDHVHIFFDAGPELQLLDLVRVIKTRTARFARKHYSKTLEQYYWKPVFWTDSYFAATVGSATHDMVEQYIWKQEQKQT